MRCAIRENVEGPDVLMCRLGRTVVLINVACFTLAAGKSTHRYGFAATFQRPRERKKLLTGTSLDARLEVRLPGPRLNFRVLRSGVKMFSLRQLLGI